MYKAVIFDFDDTLVGTIGPKFQHHKHAYSILRGGELDEEKIKLHWGKPLDQLICGLYECSIEEAQLILAEYGQYNSFYPKTSLPGRLNLINLLVERNIPIGIVTATIKPNLLADMALLGFDAKLFTYLQSKEDTQFHKPDPRVFEMIIESLAAQGIPSEKILYVGDGLMDMRAARDAGMNFIGIPNGVTSFPEDFLAEGAIAFEDFNELIEYLKENTESSNEIKIQ